MLALPYIPATQSRGDRLRSWAERQEARYAGFIRIQWDLFTGPTIVVETLGWIDSAGQVWMGDTFGLPTPTDDPSESEVMYFGRRPGSCAHDDLPHWDHQYDSAGRDEEGFDADGYDSSGYDSDGYDSDGYDSDGYDADGYDSSGYDSSGYDADGYDSSGYDSDGYDADGYDSSGYDSDGYDADGLDRDGNCRDGDCGSCDQCAMDRRRVRAYHDADRSHWRSYLSRYAGPHYGIELELWASDPDCDVAEDLPDGWIAESDGSLDRAHGVEVIGPPLPWSMARDDSGQWARFCRDMCEKAQDGSVKGHDAGTGYGMHVHVSRTAWDDESHIVRTVQAVNAWKRTTERVGQRKATGYCEIKPDLKKGEVPSLGRYSAVNVLPRNTIEFRLFRSNLRWDRMAKNLEYVRAVIEWTRCADPESEGGVDTEGAFRAWIVGPARADYPKLAEYLQCVS